MIIVILGCIIVIGRFSLSHSPKNRHSFFLEFNNDYNLQSMLVFSYHVAIIPFSWKFGFGKLSKYDELC